MTATIERFKYLKVSFDLEVKPLSEWIRDLREDSDKHFEFFVEDGKAFFLTQDLSDGYIEKLETIEGVKVRPIHIWNVE